MTEAQPYYLHLEGMDFAGKSVVAESFISNTNDRWQIWNNTIAPHIDNSIAILADKLQQEGIFDSDIHGMLYNAAIVAEIRSFKSPLINTIQDSCGILRSLAYHIVTGKERLEAELKYYQTEFPRFDSSFILTANHQARMARLALRKERGEKVSEHDLMFLKYPDKFYAMERCLVALTSQLFCGKVIDTSDMTVDQVVQKINAQISTHA